MHIITKTQAVTKLVLSITLVAALCACTSSLRKTETQQNSLPTIQPEKQEIDQLSLIVPGNGLAAAEFSGSEAGCYWIRMNTNYSANIFYIDYMSAQKIFLSDQINSLHNDPSDPSYIEDAYGGCIPIAEKNCLWILKFGASSLASTVGEKALPTLYRCDVNGENRQKLLSLEANEQFSSSSGVAADTKALYFFLDRKTQEKTVLVRIDKQTGKLEELCALPYPDTYSIVGAAEDRLAIHHVSFPGVGKKPTGKEKTLSQTYTVELFSLSTRQWEVVNAWKPLEYRCMVAEDQLVIWDPVDQAIYKQSLFNPSQKEFVCSFPEKDIKFDGIRFVGSTFDEHVFMGVTDSQHDKYEVYGIDLNTGDAIRIEKNEDGSVRGVLTESSKMFLVGGKSKIIPIEDTLEDGTDIIIESREQELYLVSKEEYWAGNQRGEPIKEP